MHAVAVVVKLTALAGVLTGRLVILLPLAAGLSKN
jgi:hypothetical protein